MYHDSRMGYIPQSAGGDFPFFKKEPAREDTTSMERIYILAQKKKPRKTEFHWMGSKMISIIP